MTDITDKTCKPDIGEITEYIGNPLFCEMLQYLLGTYNAKSEIMYSGDKALLGWNIRLFRSSRTLCRLYPRKGHFFVLLVIGRREKENAEALLPQLSSAMQAIYSSTVECMNQRWMIIDLSSRNPLYEDILKLIALRA